MANPKKNALNQILFLMVSPTDFATITSGLTAMPTGRFYGVNHGGSAAVVSGALSKTISHVRSGLYRATIKAAEANYDFVDYRFVHASAADQHIQIQYANNDDSDLMSALLVIQSLVNDVDSALTSQYTAGPAAAITVSDISNIASAVWAHTMGVRIDSNLLLTLSLASDIDSALTSQYAAGHPLTASDMSNLRSAITEGAVTLGPSDISNIASAVWAHTIGARVDSRVVLLQLSVSDIDSALTSQYTAGHPLAPSDLSDIRSAITAAAVSLDASTLSDIASQVWAHAVGVRVDSRVTITQGRVSDIQSYLVDMSGMLSNTHSAATQASSRALATFDVAADVYSLLSDVSSDLGVISDVVSGFQSDFNSRFPPTIPELTGDPGGTPTWAQAEALVFGWLKNDTTGTPTKRLLKNNAGTIVVSGVVNWDGTTSIFSQGKLG